jgi:hypothetical protein
MIAIIGRGAIGRTVAQQFENPQVYHSENIETIRNKTFNKVFCCAPTAKKYWVNQHSEEDLENIKSILEHLKTIKTDLFIMISSQDALHDSSYGKNRKFFEDEVKKIFSNVGIYRVGSLLGRFVEKNPIYDIIHDHRVEYLVNNSYQLTDIDAISYDSLTPGEENIWSKPYSVYELYRLIRGELRKFPKGDVHYNDPGTPQKNVLKGIKAMKFRYGVNSYTLNNDIFEIEKYPTYELSRYLYDDFKAGKVPRLPKSKITALSSCARGDTLEEALTDFRESLKICQELQIDKIMFGLKSLRDKFPVICDLCFIETQKFNHENNTNIKLMFEVITGSKIFSSYEQLKEFSLGHNLGYYHLDEGSAGDLQKVIDYMKPLKCINLHHDINRIPKLTGLDVCDFSGEKY